MNIQKMMLIKYNKNQAVKYMLQKIEYKIVFGAKHHFSITSSVQRLGANT